MAVEAVVEIGEAAVRSEGEEEMAPAAEEGDRGSVAG